MIANQSNLVRSASFLRVDSLCPQAGGNGQVGATTAFSCFLVFAVTLVGIGAEENPYLYGPFGGGERYACGPLGGSADYWVPGRMRVSADKGSPEFSLVKFILIETGDEKVNGLEKGYVGMGGFVAFAVEPVIPTGGMGGASRRRAPILWKGIEIRLPGPGLNDGPKILTGAGEFGGAWNLNLLLDRASFDPLWQDAEAAAAKQRDSQGKSGHHLGPIMACTIVYRNHRHVNPDERQSFTINAERFRNAFVAMEKQFGGSLVLDLDGLAITAMMRSMVSKGVIEGIEPERSGSVSEALLLSLFSSIRQGWLSYDLRAEKGAPQAGLCLRLAGDLDKMESPIVFSPGEWAGVEEYRRIDVEIEGGACAVSSLNSHGFERETKLDLEFIPYGEFDPAIVRVRMVYEIRTPDQVLDSGSFLVRMGAFDSQIREVKSMDLQDVRVRCKALGYYRKEKTGKERYVPVKSASWLDSPATLRRHLQYVLPEDIHSPELSGEK